MKLCCATNVIVFIIIPLAQFTSHPVDYDLILTCAGHSIFPISAILSPLHITMAEDASAGGWSTIESDEVRGAPCAEAPATGAGG